MGKPEFTITAARGAAGYLASRGITMSTLSDPLLPSLQSMDSGAKSTITYSLRCRAYIIICLLILTNGACFAALGMIAAHYPKFISPGILAFTFGLRHAVDADHIAAIDNVSRRLISDGQMPLLVGFWFSLGHSTVVVILCAGVAFGSTYLREHMTDVKSVGALIGTSVSAGVLLLVAGLNIWIAWKLIGSCHRIRRQRKRNSSGTSSLTTKDTSYATDNGTHVHVTSMGSVLEHSHPVSVNEEGNAVDGPGGLFSRCCPKLFGAVNAQWKMYPIGFLFGLGFDTSSEVALLGLTAMGTQKDLPAAAIMLLPCLFAAGMSLIDTLDGMMMLWAYSWAASDPLKKLYFNLFLTAVSAAIALVVAIIEVLGLIQSRLDLHSDFWDSVLYISDHFEYVGYSILAFFALSCATAWILFKCCSSAEEDKREEPKQSQKADAAEPGSDDCKGVAVAVDDYLRKRMLGLAYGEAKAIDI